MQAVNVFLGISFEGVERQAIDLFTALEKEVSLFGSQKQYKRLHREMQNLRSTFRQGKPAGRRLFNDRQ